MQVAVNSVELHAVTASFTFSCVLAQLRRSVEQVKAIAGAGHVNNCGGESL